MLHQRVLILLRISRTDIATEKLDKIIVYFDGGTHKKRVAIVDVHDGYKIRVWEHLNAQTNNEFEFIALLKALEYVHSEYGANAKNVVLYGDSQLIINGINYNRSFSPKHLQRLEKMSKRRMKKFHISPKLNWISRDQNLAGFVLEMLYKKRRRITSAN